MKLICALPYHTGDHALAWRLLEWIKELDTHVNHHLLLVADNAFPLEEKKFMDKLGKSIFDTCETIMPQCPAAIEGNYHAPAAVMFERTAAHIKACYKEMPWLWMEPDCVPLKSGWLDALAKGYDEQPKRFMGSTMKTGGGDLPNTMFFATAIYPHEAHEELKKFCDGKKAFDVAFSDHVVPRGTNSPLFQHVFGGPKDPPTFKDVKMPTDGVNTGTLESLSPWAVLWHRNKDGTLIELLRKQPKPIPAVFRETEKETMDRWHENMNLPDPSPEPIKRGPGRPPKIQQQVNP